MGEEVARQVHFTEGRGSGGVGHHGENLVIYSQRVGTPLKGYKQRSRSKAHSSYCVEYRLWRRATGFPWK